MTNLTRARLAKGYSQTVLAERAGLSRSGVWKIETEAVDGTLETWRRLARALGVDYRKILPPDRHK